MACLSGASQWGQVGQNHLRARCLHSQNAVEPATGAKDSCVFNAVATHIALTISVTDWFGLGMQVGMVIDLTNSDKYYWFDDQGASEFQYDTDAVFHRKVRLCLLCNCFTPELLMLTAHRLPIVDRLCTLRWGCCADKVQRAWAGTGPLSSE